MNILAIDYGTKIFGLAISLLNIILPYGKILYDNDENIIKKIIEIINDENINLIILGIPLNQNSNETDSSLKIRLFYKKLKESINIEVLLIDEKFSTKESIYLLKEFNYKSSEIKKIKDSISAMIILKRYLNK